MATDEQCPNCLYQVPRDCQREPCPECGEIPALFIRYKAYRKHVYATKIGSPRVVSIWFIVSTSLALYVFLALGHDATLNNYIWQGDMPLLKASFICFGINGLLAAIFLSRKITSRIVLHLFGFVAFVLTLGSIIGAAYFI